MTERLRELEKYPLDLVEPQITPKSYHDRMLVGTFDFRGGKRFLVEVAAAAMP